MKDFTVAEMKALLKDVGIEKFESILRLHCKKVFELNEHGFFDGFEFISSEVLEDVTLHGHDGKRDVIVYKCAKRDDGYDYNITVSLNGSVMFWRKCMNIFKGARFGDKFVTDNGDVLIYQRRMETSHEGSGMGVHFLIGEYKIFYVYDSGEFADGINSSIDTHVVGRFGEDDLDIVKAYVKKELADKDTDGYMQGFLDGYNNCVIV